MPSEYVYVLKASMLGGQTVFKIGRSRNPRKRLHAIRTGMPYKVNLIVSIKTDDAESLERELHRRYLSKRIRRTEWFLLDPADEQELRSKSEASFVGGHDRARRALSVRHSVEKKARAGAVNMRSRQGAVIRTFRLSWEEDVQVQALMERCNLSFSGLMRHALETLQALDAARPGKRSA